MKRWLVPAKKVQYVEVRVEADDMGDAFTAACSGEGTFFPNEEWTEAEGDPREDKS